MEDSGLKNLMGSLDSKQIRLVEVNMTINNYQKMIDELQQTGTIKNNTLGLHGDKKDNIKYLEEKIAVLKGERELLKNELDNKNQTKPETKESVATVNGKTENEKLDSGGKIEGNYTTIGYADVILNGKLEKRFISDSPREDTVYEILKDKNGNIKLGIWKGAEKRVLKNPDFLYGCGIEGGELERNYLSMVEFGELKKNDTNDYIIIKRPDVKISENKPQDESETKEEKETAKETQPEATETTTEKEREMTENEIRKKAEEIVDKPGRFFEAPIEILKDDIRKNGKLSFTGRTLLEEVEHAKKQIQYIDNLIKIKKTLTDESKVNALSHDNGKEFHYLTENTAFNDSWDRGLGRSFWNDSIADFIDHAETTKDLIQRNDIDRNTLDGIDRLREKYIQQVINEIKQRDQNTTQEPSQAKPKSKPGATAKENSTEKVENNDFESEKKDIERRRQEELGADRDYYWSNDHFEQLRKNINNNPSSKIKFNLPNEALIRIERSKSGKEVAEIIDEYNNTDLVRGSYGIYTVPDIIESAINDLGIQYPTEAEINSKYDAELAELDKKFGKVAEQKEAPVVESAGEINKEENDQENQEDLDKKLKDEENQEGDDEEEESWTDEDEKILNNLLETIKKSKEIIEECDNKLLELEKTSGGEYKETLIYSMDIVKEEIMEILSGNKYITKIYKLDLTSSNDRILLDAKVKGEKGFLRADISITADLISDKNGLTVLIDHIDAGKLSFLINPIIEKNLGMVSEKIKEFIEKKENRKVEKIWIEDGQLKAI